MLLPILECYHLFPKVANQFFTEYAVEVTAVEILSSLHCHLETGY